ncbi:MAG TPA: sulfite exporter TauE/SafE family protein [Terriglobales bacterium]|nr:sulfite exporter TauE/SafE family protein [Terriglobales bacterium]
MPAETGHFDHMTAGFVGIPFAVVVFAGHFSAMIVLLGLAVGLFVGLTSIGGGSVLTPMLILLLRIPTMVAVATSVVFCFITKGIASYQHMRQRTVDRASAISLLWGSLPAAVAGWLTLLMFRKIDILHGNVWVNREIGFALVGLGACILARDNKWISRLRAVENQNSAVVRLKLIIIGALVGFMFSTTSIGSGSVLVILLGVFAPLDENHVVGTSVFYGFVISAFVSVLQFTSGNTDWHLLGSLLLGAIPGVVIGSKLAVRAPKKFLRVCFSCAAISAGWKMV